MKKFLALVLVGAMAVGATVMAAPSPTAGDLVTATPVVPVVNSQGLTEQESNNNVVTNAPGVAETEAVGIPKGIIVNGKNVNYSIQVSKVSKEVGQSATEFANGKKVYNVISFGNMPKGEVQFTIYCKSLTKGAKVSAYQLIDGKWVKLKSVVRDNNIDVVVSSGAPVLVMADK